MKELVTLNTLSTRRIHAAAECRRVHEKRIILHYGGGGGPGIIKTRNLVPAEDRTRRRRARFYLRGQNGRYNNIDVNVAVAAYATAERNGNTRVRRRRRRTLLTPVFRAGRP